MPIEQKTSIERRMHFLCNSAKIIYFITLYLMSRSKIIYFIRHSQSEYNKWRRQTFLTLDFRGMTTYDPGTKSILVRSLHLGHANSSVDHVSAGIIDSPLSVEGYSMLCEASASIRDSFVSVGVHHCPISNEERDMASGYPQLIICSPLRRAVETAVKVVLRLSTSSDV